MVNTIRILASKTIRDLTLLAGPALVLSGVLAAGLSCLILSQSNLDSLKNSQRLTYEKLNFADAVIPLVRIPREALHPLRLLEGFTQIDCRLTDTGQVKIPAENRQIFARFHSFPNENSLNQVRIISGFRPKQNELKDAMLSDAFARAWKIRQGDSVDVLVRGKSFKFRVAALVRSPEYVYQAGPATSMPDDKLSSVWWINRRILEQTAHLQSACNEILVSTLRPDALQRSESELSSYLRRFGFTNIVRRKQMLSHHFLESEFDQLRAMSIYIPLVFVAVTLFLLHITMTRVLLSQREITGTLRAYGFGFKLIAGQSLALSFGCIFPGLCAGTFLGLWAGEQLFEIYTRFYRFAYVQYNPSFASVGAGVAIAAAAAVLGTFQGLLQILKESPAATLAPAAPAHSRKSVLDNLQIMRRIPVMARVSLRNIFRRPFQSLMTLLGLILSTALLLFARFEETAIVQMTEMEFNDTQRQSQTLVFSERLPVSAAISVIRSLPAGLSEASVVFPVVLKLGLFERELSLIVKSSPETLRQLERIPVRTLSSEGIVIPKSIAEKTGIRLPQRIRIVTKEKKAREFEFEVSDFSENLMGSVATAPPSLFKKISGEKENFNTILFSGQKNSTFNAGPLFSKFPTLLSVADKEFEKKAFESTVAENINIFRNIMIGFSLLLAMGVIYNNARIQLAEREREFALMRALGFTGGELGLLFWADYLLLTVLALPAGLWLGKKLITFIMRALETEIFRIPVIITPQSYFHASGLLIAGFLFTALLLQFRIRSLAYLPILKTRE